MENGISFKRIDCLGIYKDGQLAAIELQNGHIERFTTKECNRTDSLEIFGANKV